MSIVVIPDLSSIAFGTVAVDDRCAAQIKLLVIGFSILDPNVDLQVTPSVTSLDGGEVEVFSAEWVASPPPGPTVYSQHIVIQEGVPQELNLPIVVTASGIESGDSISGTILITGPFPSVSVPFTVLVVAPDELAFAAHLVLDASSSMGAFLPGTTVKLTTVMRKACERATALVSETDWLGVVRFRNTPAEIFKLERFADTHRATILASFTNNTYNPSLPPEDASALGKSITAAQNALGKLCSCSPPRRGVIVLTDGQATPPATPSVTSIVIGVGAASQVDPATLMAASSTGKYFLLDSMPNDGTEDAFLLDKYVIQAMAEIADLPVVFDPYGKVCKEEEVTIGFQLSEHDSEAIVMLLVDDAELVDVDLHPARADAPHRGGDEHDHELSGTGKQQAPQAGQKPDHAGSSAIDFCRTKGVSRLKADGYVAMRVNRGRRVHPSLRANGEWKVKFRLSDRARESGKELSGVRYSLVVLARSSLKFFAQVNQDHYAVGATIFLSARLSEHGAPVTSRRACVFAEIRFPDGSRAVLQLTDALMSGRFSAELRGTEPGVYRIRFRAQGISLRDQPFHRELTYTAHVARCARPCGEPRPQLPSPTGADTTDADGLEDEEQPQA